MHHPGSKQQLEEVWEKQDHMDQQFDPKAFFMMHGEWSHTWLIKTYCCLWQLHHPATREQLLDLWKHADKMDPKDFDPKVFFMMHGKIQSVQIGSV